MNHKNNIWKLYIYHKLGFELYQTRLDRWLGHLTNTYRVRTKWPGPRITRMFNGFVLEPNNTLKLKPGWEL